MSICVKLDRVSLNYPVYGYGGDSLKLRVLRMLFPKATNLGARSANVVKALRQISFSLEPGDKLGLIGSNGSGKSTLLRVLNGTYPPSEGSIVVKGRVASMLNLHCGVDGDLTGRQNIRQRLDYLGIKGSLRKSIEEEVIEFADIGEFIDLPVRMYSAGMSARLLFPLSTSGEPDIVLMDEWLAVGDANFQEKSQSRLKNFLAKSSILIIASHDHTMIKSLCSKVLTLDRGVAVDFREGQVES
jgi:ABC-type polysaccharide/polyol phosphate transport system ATPase subunit